MTQDADLARVLEAAPALAANHYGHTYLGMGNEVRRCTQPLVPTRRPSTSTGGLMSRASEHTCHAMACDAHVPPKMFMCKRHWYMLPKVMRNAVWEEYVFGQEDRMDPTESYLNVTGRAIRWLAIKEGHIEAQARLIDGGVS